MRTLKPCIQINTDKDLETILQKNDDIFVLFYASWCGFSQRFLPIYGSCSLDTKQQCYMMDVDEYPDLCDKYQIEVYPTVLFFSKGKPVKRLDGIPGVGLSESRFRGLITECSK
jgi:thiol-disulfide isomerase/thioredoxin